MRRSRTQNAPASPVSGSQRLTLGYSVLTGAQRKLADHVLAHRFEAATLTINQLAQRAGVSVASANRFARALGYPGWAEFRAHWQAELKPMTSALDKLQDQQRRRSTSADEHVRAALHDGAQALRRCESDLPAEPVRSLAQRLIQARRVAVFGADVSTYLAGYFASYLSLFRADVVNLAQGGAPSEAFRRVLDLGADDVLLLLSLPRYSTLTIELADFATGRGVPIAALTDVPGAPVAARARWVLLAPAAAATLPASAVALVTLLEGLCAAVAARSTRRAHELPALMDALAAHHVQR